MARIHYLPTARHPWKPEGLHDFEPLPAERFELRGWADGYVILEQGEVICTFHGPQLNRAWETLKRLREDAR
jgi:hypothetical protein